MGENVFQKRVKEIVTRDTVTLNADDTVHQGARIDGAESGLRLAGD